MQSNNEYLFPELYDAEYGSFSGDFNFFCSHISQGTVLDLACGTGRLTIALAKAGYKVFGIDENIHMIERAQVKSQGLDIHYSQHDMRSFIMNQRFDLITLAGNSFQALLTRKDQECLIVNVHSHLTEDGLFIFNTRNPTPETCQTTKNFEFWHDFKDPDGILVRVFGKQQFDKKNQIITYTTKRIWPDHETFSTIELKCSSLDDILDVLNKYGFNVIHYYGDFEQSAWSPKSKSIIVVAAKRP